MELILILRIRQSDLKAIGDVTGGTSATQKSSPTSRHFLHRGGRSSLPCKMSDLSDDTTSVLLLVNYRWHGPEAHKQLC